MERTQNEKMCDVLVSVEDEGFEELIKAFLSLLDNRHAHEIM